ncbi:MAG: alpha/beta fold hydrolase [Deltaproteobacteria bacterium]|nr:alpha/beta fold hydrolase [Deltaproteobacteria bacterium]
MNTKNENFLEQLLKPLDWSLGFSLKTIKKTYLGRNFTLKSFSVFQFFLSQHISRYFKLKTEGKESLPPQGPLILVANHQSWLDIPLIAAAIPEKICFLIPDEYQKWPFLHQLIELSGSIYIESQEDDRAFEEAAERLARGEWVCLFPEGQIPGDKISRMEVERDTGLLPGHTGFVRLALLSGAPILPIGISGSGKAFPPEAYPHRDISALPKRESVKVKIGKLHSLTSAGITKGKNQDLALWSIHWSKEKLMSETKKIMEFISKLIDPVQNYIPLKLPLKELPQYSKIGVLVLHGFTSSLKAVDGIKSYLEKSKLPYAMPLLRGHGSQYKDLAGVTWNEWVADAEKALFELSEKVEKVIVVGLSMGGLVALKLGLKHPDKIAGVVTVAAALKFADPLAPLTKIIAKIVPYWPGPKSFNDPECAKQNQNYSWFPTDAFCSLYDFAKHIEKNLSKFKVPLLVIHSKKDSVISPIAASIIYEKVGSEWRDIKWFQKSGHDMMQDYEAKEVFAEIMDFVLRFRKVE